MGRAYSLDLRERVVASVAAGINARLQVGTTPGNPIMQSQWNQAQVALASSNAKRQAETVMRSLTDMGLPANRVSLSASTSAQAQTNEVHLYVR